MPGASTVDWAFGHWLRLIVRRWFPAAAAFLRRGDWSRIAGLCHASAVCHAARGSRHRCPESEHSPQRAAVARRLRHRRSRRVSATVRSLCCSHALACDRSRRCGCRRDDLDCFVGRIVVRGRGVPRGRVPLPADVGEALSAYLCQPRLATGQPPGVNGALLVGLAVSIRTRPHRHSGFQRLAASMATDDTIPIRPDRAKLWAITR